jgi:hypothetical protein
MKLNPSPPEQRPVPFNGMENTFGDCYILHSVDHMRWIYSASGPTPCFSLRTEQAVQVAPLTGPYGRSPAPDVIL